MLFHHPFLKFPRLDENAHFVHKLDKLYGDAEEIKFVSIDERAAAGEL